MLSDGVPPAPASPRPYKEEGCLVVVATDILLDAVGCGSQTVLLAHALRALLAHALRALLLLLS